MLERAIKVNIPQNQQNKKSQQSTISTDPMKSMQEINIDNYTIKSQHISSNCIDGYSIIYLNKDIVYQGEMIRSQKNGFGVEYGPKGIIYQGYFRDDKYDGWGKTPCYTGQFRDGFYDGYGIYSTENYYYQGFFQKAQPSGEGISFKGTNMVNFHPVKNIYDFLNEGIKNNMKILQDYNIEEIYLGDWKQGVKHGFGRLWRSNYWYSGQFSNDLPHGLGAEEIKTIKNDKEKDSKVVQTIYKLGVKK